MFQLQVRRDVGHPLEIAADHLPMVNPGTIPARQGDEQAETPRRLKNQSANRSNSVFCLNLKCDEV